MTLGEQLRAGREAKRMTLRAFSRAMGVSAPFMSDVEHGRRPLSPERIAQAAKILELDPVLLDAANGYTRELADWIRNSPEMVAFLRTLRSREPLVIGGPDCPCCGKPRCP